MSNYITIFEGSTCESSLQYYTGKGYELINAYMRGENIKDIIEFEYENQISNLTEEELEEAIEEVELELNKLIDELYLEFTELEEDLIVYRGGGKKENSAFRSYTTDIEVAKDFGKVEKLTLKKGTKIIDTRGKSWTEGESEIILEPNN